MAAASYYVRDDPWRRLPWLLPIALFVSAASIVLFLWLLSGPATRSLLPVPIEVQVVDLPPAPIASPAQAVAQPSPPPEPEAPPPAPEILPPEPEPPPEPVVKPEPAPEPPPRNPPPRIVRQAKPVMTPAPAQPPNSTPAPSIQAPPPRTPAPGGGSTGARAIYKPMPEIPEQLRRRVINLVALARFHVAANGAAEVELVEPTPEPALNHALLDTLRKWRFFPAVADGKPIASTVEIRIPLIVQ